jgi:hypothetical protein
MQGSSIEMQTPTHWTLFGRNATASPPVLTPSNILLAMKNFSKILIFFLI